MHPLKNIELLDAQKAALLLGVSRNFIYHLINMITWRGLFGILSSPGISFREKPISRNTAVSYFAKFRSA